ncbi:MAG: class I SAM-dependent methyltransferase [Bacteroidota bacterium]
MAESPILLSAVAQAHVLVERAVHAGATVVDATAGNGHDTAYLARLVGPAGRVLAFDVQPEALAATRHRLVTAGLLDRVRLVAQGHETMAGEVGEAPRLQAVMFNLGYLPGGPSKALTTQPRTTLVALEAAWARLAPGGLITVVCYTGHPGGLEETRAVEAWATGLEAGQARMLSYRFLNQTAPPRLLAIERRIT